MIGTLIIVKRKTGQVLLNASIVKLSIIPQRGKFRYDVAKISKNGTVLFVCPESIKG